MQSMTSRLTRIVAVMTAVGLIVAGITLGLRPTAQAAGGLGLTFETYAEGFDKITDIANAGDERLFIVEQEGVIRVVDAAGATLPTPFLNITEKVCSGYQLGLLGAVFHPDYDENGYFFLNYLTPRTGTDCTVVDTIIARYRVSSDPNVADAASEAVVLRIEQPIDDNKGGDLAFGPNDGYLYIPLGDGGGPRNINGPTQDGQSLLGKVLRIDVSTSETGDLYTIPPTNPFVNDPAVRDEIWSSGWRNPWRFSFDSATGDMYVADVGGEQRREEIDFQAGNSAGGENYGWPCAEGFFVYTDTSCSGVLTPPIFEGQHGMGAWVAITGGFVYRGEEYPLLQGYYIFSDAGTGSVFTLKRDDQGVWQTTEEGKLAVGEQSIATFGEGADGTVYAADYTFSGDRVYRVVDGRPQPTVTPTVTPTLTPTATPTTPPQTDSKIYLPLVDK